MALTQEQIEKIATLFTSGDFSYAKQGIELVDALIDNEQDFVTLLETMGSSTLTDFTFDELKSVFGFVSEESHRYYLAFWALGTLAQWNQKACNTTALNLTWRALTELPESIGNLTNLTTLLFRDNQLTTLPESFGNLTNLTKLSLGNYQLTTLPDWIGNLTNLTELCLYDNQFTTLPESIGNLTNLTYLTLSDNPISESEQARIQALLPT